jgi:uncharacterized membrane protein YhaH (DUF805 family)
MFGSIKYNLAHLLDFRGRDARQTFWFYVLFLVILRILIGIGLVIPMMANAVGQVLDQAKTGVTDQQAITTSLLSQMGPWMQTVAYVSVGVGLVMILLLLAAFVRRLHDSNKTGWWAAIPVATELASLWGNYRRAGRIGEALSQAVQQAEAGGAIAHQRETSILGLLGWLGVIVVIVFGIMKSTEGPNPYGNAPVQF